MARDRQRSGRSTERVPASVAWRRADCQRVVVIRQQATPSAAAVASLFTDDSLDVIIVAIGRQMIDDVVALDPDAVVVEHDGQSSAIARVCRQLSSAIGCRMLVVAADAASPDDDVVISVLDAGADDYLVAASGRVLLARLRVALRAGPLQRSSQMIVAGDVIIDREAHIVSIDGENIDLPPVRFELLAALASRQNSVVNYETLLEEVWGDRSTTAHPHRLRSAVSLLRNALGEGRLRPRIENIAHVGYRLVAGSPSVPGNRVDNVA